MAQRGVQLRQRGMCVIDHRQHGRSGRAAAIKHAVEHAFDLPGELAQGARPHQAATALEGVEDAPDRPQPVHVVQLHTPCRQQRAKVGQLVVELFQEHLADVLVDVLGIVVEAGLEAGLGPSHDRDVRSGRSRHGLRIEVGRRSAQLGKELRVGFAEIDGCDGVDINHRHRRCRCTGGRRQHLGHRRGHVLRHTRRNGVHSGNHRAFVYPQGRGGIDDLQRRMQSGVVVQRQRLHRVQRQHVVGIVQCIAVETEYHVLAGGNRIVLGSDRVEHRRGKTSGVEGHRGVGVALDSHHGRIGHCRRRCLRQCPLRRRSHSGFDPFETDRVEAGEGRTALVFGTRGRIGVGMERCEIPLRHVRCRRAGGGEDQGRICVILQRQRCGCNGPQRTEHQAVVHHLRCRRGRWRIKGKVRQRHRHSAGGGRGRLHRNLDALRLQRLGLQRDRLPAFDQQRCERNRRGGNRFHRVAIRQRPVAQRFKAAAGDVENVLAARAAVAQCFEVVLQAGHGIGQGVQLTATGHALATDQLGFDVLLHTAQVIGSRAQIQHAQRAGDIAQQARHVLQLGMVPAGFNERDEVLARGGEVGDGLMRQHFNRAPVLHRARIVLATAAGAQMSNLVIQRGIHVQQCPGDIQQQVLVDLLAPFDHATQCITLLHDHAAGHAQAHHAQRIGHRTELVGLGLQLLRRTAGTQVQVQRILDAQQFFLHCTAHGIEQLAVAPAQTAAGMVQLGLGGGDAVRCECQQYAVMHAFFATCGADLVEQRHQHDRDIAMPVLQALQVVGQQHAATHQGRAGFIPIGHTPSADGIGQLFKLLGHHRRGIQFDHAQGALHLVQVAGADAHAAGIGRVFRVVLDLVAHLAQGLVQLRLDPTQRCVAHRIAQTAHGRAPFAAARKPREFWRGEWKCFIDWFLARRPARVTPAA